MHRTRLLAVGALVVLAIPFLFVALDPVTLNVGDSLRVECPNGKLTISNRSSTGATNRCRSTTSPTPSPSPSPPPSPTPTSTTSAPPDPAGYFALRGVGAALPNDCATQVHRSRWEPRPTNTQENQTVPSAAAVHASFAARPRASVGTYDPRWDSQLLPRVDGQFTGTTDEIFQWAACKWGLSDNMLRAIAVRESTWFEVLHFNDGSCYWNRGCGDAFPSPSTDSGIYCDGLATFGHDYQADVNGSVGAAPYAPRDGMCPKTFSIVGIMAWEAPAWTAPAPPYPGNQNGTFPFSRNSTAFAVDYIASFLRGCYDGWIEWLNPAGGDIWGCVGSWYAGNWHSADADGYIGRVQTELTNHTWLTPAFAGVNYSCDPQKGCPV